MDNVEKSKTMTYQSGAIHTGMSEEAFSQNNKLERATYWEQLQWRIPCPYCGVELTYGSTTAHSRLFHGMDPSIDW